MAARTRPDERYRGGDLLKEAYLCLCESIDSAVSLSCWLLYKYSEHAQLAQKKVDPSQYSDANNFRDDYLVVSYLSKYKGLKTNIDVEKVAIQSFHESELKCRETNQRIRSRAPATAGVEAIILMAQRKIADILGPLDLTRIFEHCSWSGGATATLREAEANVVRKMDENPISVSRGALPYLRAIIEQDYCWGAAICKAQVVGPYRLLDCCFKIVEYDRVTTVSKDATKDRTISAQPTGSVFVQKGPGQFIRRRLKKHARIDLNSQANNQELARLASITGEFATEDLRSASDTVSKLLVFELLPYDWSELLDQLRCREYMLPDGSIHRYEKFSCMGNGFTFELESLIFYALSWATVRYCNLKGPTLVYGDDIIIRSAAHTQLIEVLTWCGFEINTKKSHHVGYFRESCGSHYWNGSDVTPVYQKELLHTNKRILREEVYRCANRIVRLAYRRGHFLWLDEKLKRCWRQVRRLIKNEHFVPLSSEDDAGIALPKEELDTRILRPRRGNPDDMSAVRNGRIILPVLSFRQMERDVPPFYQGALLAYWLRFNPTEPLSGKVAVRRKGNYVSRRRTYPRDTPNVAWL